MAAAALFSLSPAPEVGNPDRMVPRGLEDTLSPEIHMKMAVETNGALERHRRGTHYREGDRFFFRYQVAAPGWVHLVRADTAGLSVLKSVEVSAGEDDLRHDGELLSWTTDATDGAAVFGLLATPTPVPDLGRQLTDALATFPETDATLVCSAAMREGWTCDAVDVEVLP